MLAMKKLSGKELSYNNLGDMETALAVIREFGAERPCVCIVKHATPCGVAVAETIEEAYKLAYEADSVSAYGGIVAANRQLGASVIEKMAEIFLEVVVAPSFSGEAINMFSKKPSVRFVELPIDEIMKNKEAELKALPGGFLLQEPDTRKVTADDLKVATKRRPTDDEVRQLLDAWKVIKHVKSNAILLWKGSSTVGVGGGQTNRVGAAKIAAEAAGKKAKGSVMASDAFFPFKDTVEVAASIGVKAIIQPGGSIRDKESIEECDKHGIAMVFTSVRHFKH
jgi:phosphoribosylaminoimidazolecarboxamide formyltransferase/IMP cyclohydrolase